MAVTLLQMSKERERASTLPTMARVNHNEVVSMPMPAHYQYQPYDTGSSPRHSWSSFGLSPQFLSSQSTVRTQPWGPTRAYGQSPKSFLDTSRNIEQRPPSLPPKIPLHSTSQPSTSPQSSRSSGDSSPSSTDYSIEPDPLPPHSNPQALSQTQSEAFSDSQPVFALRLGKDEVWNTRYGTAEFRIASEAAHMPKLLSSKPLLTVTKTSHGRPMGSIRFHHVTSNNIQLIVNSQQTSISHSGMLHNRWAFRTTTTSDPPQKWYWKRDRSTGGAMLEDAKRNGSVIARMKGDLLTFEKAKLSPESYDEVVVSAIAITEAARRQKRKTDIADIGGAIADFAGTDGGSRMNGQGTQSGSA